MRVQRLVIVLILVSAAAAAAESPFAVITHIEGSEIAVFRQAQPAVYRPGQQQLVGAPVFAGDVLQTADDSYLEIQLYPAGDTVSVFGGSSIEVRELGSQPRMRLNYGSLRLRATDDQAGPLVAVQAGQARLELDSGDVYVSYRLPAGAPAGISVVLEVAVADGSASLQGSVDPDQPATQVDIAAGQQLQLGLRGSGTAGQAEILSEGTIDDDLRGFLESTPLQGRTAAAGQVHQQFVLLDYIEVLRLNPRALPSRQLASPSAPGQQRTAQVSDTGLAERTVTYTPPEQLFFTPNPGLQGAGTGLFAVGAITEVLGLTLLVFGDSLLSSAIPNQTARQGLTYGMVLGGGVIMGVGTGMFFLSFGL
ncbi:hypothetical protein [Spirochaeta africana]|uniref:FecR protein domain-containing protein n=1 Tax=Spirochaeta africana (strain ATCC 700263 / DSM 8902 / Z-7692) TaxID=889378 RepID=H9UIY8_SPIAZ|nr:hypothetical protein [Spirochaeta africana]AFG37481.1 hypothetical protein Spiaf_1418 [Spirochaeta africana DSM 8902]